MVFDKEALAALKAKLVESNSQVQAYFNENLHSTYAQRPIRLLRFAPRISQKLFFPLLMAFPFDPFTGKETDDYNSQKKYIAMESPEAFMYLIKAECDADEKLKLIYMRQARYNDPWDTTDLTTINTVADQAILWRYRRRMTYAFPSLRIMAQSISGEKFPTTFLLSTKQDAITGEFTGDLSTMHKVGAMIGSLCRREIFSFNEGIESKNPDTLSRKLGRSFALPADYLQEIPNTDHEKAKDRRSEIRKCYPMREPQPMLTTIGLSFDVTPVSGTMVEQIGEKKWQLYPHFMEDVSYNKFIFYTDNFAAIEAIDSVIGNYYPKDPRKMAERNPEVDLYPNYCVLNFITEDTRTKFVGDEKMHAARKMVFATEKKPMYDVTANDGEGGWIHKGLDEFMDRMAGFFSFASEEDLATRVRDLLVKSYKPVTTAMEEAAFREITVKFPLTNPLYDDNIIVQFGDLLRDIFPEQMASEELRLGDKIDEQGEDLVKELLEQEASKSSDGLSEEDKEAFEEDDPPYDPLSDDSDQIDADTVE